MSHLTESLQELVDLERQRVESVMSTRFGDFVEKVRVYLTDRDFVLPQILVETQMAGVVSCLTRYVY